MTVKTNDAGEYTLQLLISGYQVRLLAIGQGLTGQLSPYLDPSQERQWNATLQVRPAIDPKAPFQTQVLDGEKASYSQCSGLLTAQFRSNRARR